MSAPKNCRWCDQTESRLVDYVSTNRSEAADGMSFKKSFWERVAKDIAKIEAPAQKPKSAKSCAQKWSNLKAECLLVMALKRLSGIQWDETLGFNVGATSNRSEGTALEIFEEYILKNPKAAKFKRKGFPLYEAIFDLLPSKARGANVFRPSQTQPTPSTSKQSYGADNLGSESSSDEEGEDEPVPTQEWPASPPVTLKRKISVIDLTSESTSNTAPPAKRARLVPLLELSNRLGELTDVYRQTKAAPSTTSTPTRQRAIKDVEYDPDLELSEKVSLLNSFMRSTTAVSIYNALPEGSEIRTAWAKDQHAQELAKQG